MKDIKNGEYVRTYDGIGKVVETRIFLRTDEFRLDSGVGNITQIPDNTKWNDNRNVIKSSPNIIDLIERFDFANGHLVICKMYEDEKDIPTIIKCVGDYYFKEEDIKSIVTKEQFSQMEYRIGE